MLASENASERLEEPIDRPGISRKGTLKMAAIQVCANVLLHTLSSKSSLCLIPEPVSFPEVCSTVLANPNTSDDNR